MYAQSCVIGHSRYDNNVILVHSDAGAQVKFVLGWRFFVSHVELLKELVFIREGGDLLQYSKNVNTFFLYLVKARVNPQRNVYILRVLWEVTSPSIGPGIPLHTGVHCITPPILDYVVFYEFWGRSPPSPLRGIETIEGEH